ncbi:MAG TPA: response regulator, partial [Longimicrobium sp.]|nr:response regulator [Longimicrobium sp.]
MAGTLGAPMATFRSILIAEDEPSIRHVLTLLLTEKGYDVRAVSDGEEALRELNARPYDVVISDVRMPKMDGISLLKQALPQHPELTFIVMSAHGSPEAALESVGLGAFGY